MVSCVGIYTFTESSQKASPPTTHSRNFVLTPVTHGRVYKNLNAVYTKIIGCVVFVVFSCLHIVCGWCMYKISFRQHYDRGILASKNLWCGMSMI